MEGLLAGLFERLQIGLSRTLVIAIAVMPLGLLQSFQHRGLDARLRFDHTRRTHSFLGRELHTGEPLALMADIQLFHHLRKKQAHGFLLFFIRRELFRKIWRQDVSFAQRFVHTFRVSRKPGLDSFDQRVGGQQQVIGLVNFLERRSPLGVIDQRLALQDLFAVFGRQRIQKIV